MIGCKKVAGKMFTTSQLKGITLSNLSLFASPLKMTDIVSPFENWNTADSARNKDQTSLLMVSSNVCSQKIKKPKGFGNLPNRFDII